MTNSANDARARAEALFKSPARAENTSQRLLSEQEARREKTERLRAMRLQQEEASQPQPAAPGTRF